MVACFDGCAMSFNPCFDGSVARGYGGDAVR